MAIKRIFADIQGDIFDLWNLVSAERGPDDYDEIHSKVVYTLIINDTAVARDIRQKTYRFYDEDERDNKLLDIKEALKKNPNIYFLGEDDGTINEDELKAAGFKRGKYKNEDGPNYDEDEE